MPIVCMPVFHDQDVYRARVERKGVGVGITKHATAEEILDAIRTVINDRR